MARTIDATIDLPVAQATPQAEVMDTNGKGGLAIIARAINSLWEHKRWQYVCDANPKEILNAASEVARYRVKVPSTGLEETVTVHVCYALSGGGTCTLELGSGYDNDSFALSPAATPTWLEGVSIALDPSHTGYADLTLSVTSLSGTLSVYSIMVLPDRSRTEVPSGRLDDGFVGLDLSHIDGECPVSTHRLFAMHKGLRLLYEQRIGQCLTVSRQSEIYEQAYRSFRVPEGVTGLTVWIYADRVDTGDITITVAGTDEVVTPVAGGGYAWHETSFTVTPGTVVEMSIISSGSATWTAASAWWDDADYDLAVAMAKDLRDTSSAALRGPIANGGEGSSDEIEPLEIGAKHLGIARKLECGGQLELYTLLIGDSTWYFRVAREAWTQMAHVRVRFLAPAFELTISVTSTTDGTGTTVTVGADFAAVVGDDVIIPIEIGAGAAADMGYEDIEVTVTAPIDSSTYIYSVSIEPQPMAPAEVDP